MVKIKIQRIDGEFDNFSPEEHVDFSHAYRRKHIAKCFGKASEEVSRNLWVWNFVIDNDRRCSLVYDSNFSDTKEIGTISLHWSKEDFNKDEISNVTSTIERILGVDLDIQDGYELDTSGTVV